MIKRVVAFFLFLSLATSVSSQEYTKVTLEKDEKLVNQIETTGVILLTTGFKSCSDCYSALNETLKTETKLNKIHKYWLAAYNENLFSRKLFLRNLQKLVDDKNINLVFDDSLNSTFSKFSIEIMPSIILLKGGRSLYIDYKDIFKGTEVNRDVINKIIVFFK